jgi:hypothetical protein
MCGYLSLNWIYSLTTLLLFAALMVASVVLLVRSLNSKSEGREDDES